MVMTILEATVQSDKRATLEREFNQAIQKLDTGIVATFLTQNTKETDTWRIVTLWANREALAAMRTSGETPRGVLIFRAAGGEPTLTIWDVPAHNSIR